MTEEEAKKKWCPESRHSFDEQTGPGWNTGESHNCIGSRCMAWRWIPSVNTAGRPVHGSGNGFCGLAGKP